jgi:hypothetical protein
METFYSNVSAKEPVRYGQFPFSIGVLPHPMGSPEFNLPIGMAGEVGRTDGGLALWKLTIHGFELPGRWIIVDREFRPAQ